MPRPHPAINVLSYSCEQKTRNSSGARPHRAQRAEPARPGLADRPRSAGCRAAFSPEDQILVPAQGTQRSSRIALSDTFYRHPTYCGGDSGRLRASPSPSPRQAYACAKASEAFGGGPQSVRGLTDDPAQLLLTPPDRLHRLPHHLPAPRHRAARPPAPAGYPPRPVYRVSGADPCDTQVFHIHGNGTPGQVPRPDRASRPKPFHNWFHNSASRNSVRR